MLLIRINSKFKSFTYFSYIFHYNKIKKKTIRVILSWTNQASVFTIAGGRFKSLSRAYTHSAPPSDCPRLIVIFKWYSYGLQKLLLNWARYYASDSHPKDEFNYTPLHLGITGSPAPFLTTTLSIQGMSIIMYSELFGDSYPPYLSIC